MGIAPFGARVEVAQPARAARELPSAQIRGLRAASSHLVLSHLVLSHLVLSHLVLSHSALSHSARSHSARSHSARSHSARVSCRKRTRNDAVGLLQQKIEFEFQCRSLESFHAEFHATCASCSRKSSSNSNSIFANRPPTRAMRATMILCSDKMPGTFRNDF
jgi:hypothetical protein